jgi:hypothetical protein
MGVRYGNQVTVLVFGENTMNEKQSERLTNTYSEAILVEFTSTESRNLDEARLEPRYGRPSPEILAERAREAAQFLAELEKQKKPPEAGPPNNVEPEKK